MMKKFLRAYRISWFVGFCLAGILAIVACNLCLLYFGHCVVNDFLAIPPIGWFIIAANLVAGAALAMIKRRGGQKFATNQCSRCSIGLLDTWAYCPNCGEDVTCRMPTGILARSSERKIA